MTRHRCHWVGNDPLMQAYHDEEWGVPIHDDRLLWETLVLEGFQAGLSWITVLRKREAFRQAFAGFDPDRVARYDEQDVQRLLTNTGIIRSRAKIEATILGAQRFCDLRDRGERFNDFCWSFTEGQPLQGDGHTLLARSPLSEQLSKALKQQGFKFVGPTIVQAWMQAVGLINDHASDCFRRQALSHR